MKKDSPSHTIDREIKYRTDDAVFQMHHFNLDIKANHIYLFGEDAYVQPELVDEGEPGIDWSLSNKFIKNLNILMRLSDDPILIHLKSCGGIWAEGIAIYDAIQACPNSVSILNYTHARSMSSIIFLAGDKRIMMKHSTFMFHGGDMAFDGTTKQFLTEADQVKRTHNEMMDIYVDCMEKQGKMKGKPRKKIREWLDKQMDSKEEAYYTAEESVHLGFADLVFGEDGKYDYKALTDFSHLED